MAAIRPHADTGLSQPGRVTLRDVEPADAELLIRVYASTREAELTLVEWDNAQKEAFLRTQFSAQDHHYRTHYAGATFSVIIVGGEPAGRLYVARWPAEIRIMDIALLPEFRNRGVGTRLLEQLLEEAAAGGKTATIHVERFNPALSLYWRLGFRPVADRGVYLLMEWLAGPAVAAKAQEKAASYRIAGLPGSGPMGTRNSSNAPSVSCSS